MKPRLPLLAAICVAPRRTMRWMLEHPQRRWSFAVVMLAVLSMLIVDFSPGKLRAAMGALGVPATVFAAVLLTMNVLMVSLVVFYGLPTTAVLAGRMLGGTGTFGRVRTAVCWGLAPQIWALIYRLPVVLLWPEFTGERPPAVAVSAREVVFMPLEFSAGAVAFGALELAVVVWTLFVGSRTLAEAHGISPWRGLANLLLAVVLPFIVILTIIAAAALAIWSSGVGS